LDLGLWTLDFFLQRAFDGVGGEGFQVAGEGGDFALSRENAKTEAHVSGFTRVLPELVGFDEIALQAVGGDVLGDAECGGFVEIAIGWQSLREPVQDLLDDLPDAGLRDADGGRDLSRAGAIDGDALIDKQIAAGRREWEGD
jgi:hypothetical protein